MPPCGGGLHCEVFVMTSFNTQETSIEAMTHSLPFEEMFAIPFFPFRFQTLLESKGTQLNLSMFTIS